MKIGGTFTGRTSRGLFQGSVGAPKLFIIYLQSLLKALKEVKAEVVAYCDDVAIVLEEGNLEKVI